METRYLKNMKTLTLAENEGLRNFKVCVVGCGGLGGYIIELLGRLGIGHITAVDGDVFEESNLNRQLLSDMGSLGRSKSEAATKRMEAVNPLIRVQAVRERITPENGEAILKGHDVVVDAVDNIDSRFLLQELCSCLGVPLVHGAIAGWYGQVSTILPGDKTLDHLYSNRSSNGLEKEMGNPAFTPALVASIQVSEVLKILIGRGELLRRKILYIDLLHQEYTLINMEK